MSYATAKIKSYKNIFLKTVAELQNKNKILFLTTSNRWSGEDGGEQPKSTRLAYKMAEKLGNKKVKIIEVDKLTIHTCEGNVSTQQGNNCGEVAAILKDGEKNPSGCHRCWASLNNPDDELWKISRELLASDCVVIFGSIRWGQMNSVYQKMIERLTWLENRHSNLGDSNLLKDIEAGIIAVGHNWNSSEVLKTQKKVLNFFGFKVNKQLCWDWFYTHDIKDETTASYLKANSVFDETFLI